MSSCVNNAGNFGEVLIAEACNLYDFLCLFIDSVQCTCPFNMMHLIAIICMTEYA